MLTDGLLHRAAVAAFVLLYLPPGVPTALGQFRIDAVTPVAVGGTTAQASVFMRGTITDPDGDQVRFPASAAITGRRGRWTRTECPGRGCRSTPRRRTSRACRTRRRRRRAPRSTTARVVRFSRSAGHWQYRVVDDQGNAGAWTPFGGNLDPSDVDFIWRGPGVFGGSRNHQSCIGSAAAVGGAWPLLAMVPLVFVLRRRRAHQS